VTAILIPTMPDDTHAINVKLALDKKGISSVLWYTADFPTQQTHTFAINHNDIEWQAQGVDLDINKNKFDVVWFRRPKRPRLPYTLHPDDKENVKNETGFLFQTLWQVIAPDAYWVNPAASAKVANSKLLQLNIASRVGLTIPPTIISSNPDHIRTFIQQQKDGETIYKTLAPMYWFEENDVRLTYTKPIRISDLPEDHILQLTPGIFQQRIPKAYELRVTYFGTHPVAVKLHSQNHPKGIMDWRYIPTHEMVIEPYTLPPEIDARCQAFMRELGVVFGCFDFIVTPDGDYYFLEMNEAGQFLWIEQLNPDIPMLDIFTNFLTTKQHNFQYKMSESRLYLDDFKNQADKQLQHTLDTHVKTDLI
jgi:glutathione synthase/RimK-type ligase-like ATP-grasp enzyme